MKCEKYRKDISAFVDNELNILQKYFLKIHLKKCKDCAKELEDLKKTKKLLSMPIESIAADNIWIRVNNRLENFKKPAEREARPAFLYAILAASVMFVLSCLIYAYMFVYSGNIADLNVVNDKVIGLFSQWKTYMLVAAGILAFLGIMAGSSFLMIFTLIRKKAQRG